MALGQGPEAGEKHCPDDAWSKKLSLARAQMVEQPEPVRLEVGGRSVGHQRVQSRWTFHTPAVR